MVSGVVSEATGSLLVGVVTYELHEQDSAQAPWLVASPQMKAPSQKLSCKKWPR